ncbi:MAG: hypothetical protein LBH28_06555, partial [Oscillospiraceae bacterium]|nr:hypothetical protein [Oscillospiraceae bacterium]
MSYSLNREYSFAVTGDRTLVARFAVKPIVTFIKIAKESGIVPSMFTISRNSTEQFIIVANDGVSLTGIVWRVSDPSFATVDENGKVVIKNKAGMVVLTAT